MNKRVGNFKVVAENFVVPQFQRFYAGAFLFVGFQFAYLRRPVFAEVVQFVKFRIVAFLDKVAVAHHGWHVVDYRPVEKRIDRAIDVRQNFAAHDGKSAL